MPAIHESIRFHIIEHDPILLTIKRTNPRRHTTKSKFRYLSHFSCRGLLVEGLCRASSVRSADYWLPATKYRICNPTTKRVLDLPLPHEGVIVMGVFLNSATNSYNVVSLYSDRLEQKVNFQLLDLGGQSTDPCPDENLSWRTLDIPEYDEASRLQEYDGKRCVMEEGILLMPALHKVESGNGVILCVDLVQQACTTLNAPHSLSLEDSEINLQLWRGKPALSFVSEEKLNVCILEDYQTQTWADTILIPLPNLNNAIPRVKKQIPQIHRMDEEDFLFYTDDFYTNGVKGYRVCKTGSEELIFASTSPPTRVPATLVSVKGMRPLQ